MSCDNNHQGKHALTVMLQEVVIHTVGILALPARELDILRQIEWCK